MISLHTLLLVIAVYLGVWMVWLPVNLWTDFLAVMNIKRVRDLSREGKGPPPTKAATYIGGYILIRGYLRDFAVNTLHLSVMLRELPRWPRWARRSQYPKFSAWLLKDGELTVSERLKRHINTPDSPHRERCLALQSAWLRDYDVSGGHGLIEKSEHKENK